MNQEDHHDKVHPPDSNVDNSGSDQVDNDRESDKVTVTCSGCISKPYNQKVIFQRYMMKQMLGKVQLMHIVYVPVILTMP